MKLHLPSGLRNALLACLAAVSGFATTLATATLAAGAFAATLASTAQAADYTATVASSDSQVILTPSKSLWSTSAEDTVTFGTWDEETQTGTGITGWLENTGAVGGTMTANAKLIFLGDGLTISAGSKKTYKFAGDVSGAGDFTIATSGNDSDHVYEFTGDLAGFTGDFAVTTDDHCTIKFTNAAEAAKTINAATITVDSVPLTFSGDYKVASVLDVATMKVLSGTTTLSGAGSQIGTLTVDAGATLIAAADVFATNYATTTGTLKVATGSTLSITTNNNGAYAENNDNLLKLLAAADGTEAGYGGTVKLTGNYSCAGNIDNGGTRELTIKGNYLIDGTLSINSWKGITTKLVAGGSLKTVNNGSIEFLTLQDFVVAGGTVDVGTGSIKIGHPQKDGNYCGAIEIEDGLVKAGCINLQHVRNNPAATMVSLLEMSGGTLQFTQSGSSAIVSAYSGSIIRLQGGTLSSASSGWYVDNLNITLGGVELVGSGAGRDITFLNGTATLTGTMQNNMADGAKFQLKLDLQADGLDVFDEGYSEGANGYLRYWVVKGGEGSDLVITDTVTVGGTAMAVQTDYSAATHSGTLLTTKGNAYLTQAGTEGVYYVNSGSADYAAGSAIASDTTTGIVLNGGNLNLQSALNEAATGGITVKQATTITLGGNGLLNKSQLHIESGTVTLAGTGTYAGTALADFDAVSGLTAEAWKGTVSMNGVEFAATNLNTYGNSGSTIELINTTGYFNQANNNSPQTYSANIKLTKDAAGHAAFTANNGWGGDNRTFSGTVSGDGDFVRNSVGSGQTYNFTGDVSGWTGSFTHKGTSDAFQTTLTFSNLATEINAGFQTDCVAASYLTVVVDNNSDVAVKGAIAGNTKVTYKGTGTKTVGGTGTNTYTGLTTIEAGVVKTAADGALGSGTVRLSGGSLQAENALGNSIEAGTAATIAKKGETAVSYAGVTLTQTGIAATEGATTSAISGAAINVTGAYTLSGIRLSNSTLTAAEGMLTATGLTLGSDVALAGTLTLGAAGSTTTIDGTLTNSGRLALAGTIRVATPANLENTAETLSHNGNGFRSATYTLIRKEGSGTIDNDIDNLTVSIDGHAAPVDLALDAAGNVVFTTSDTHYEVLSGTVQYSSDSTLTTDTSITTATGIVMDGGNLVMHEGLSSSITGGTGIEVKQSGTITLKDGVTLAAADVTVSGGTLSLAGTGTYAVTALSEFNHISGLTAETWDGMVSMSGISFNGQSLNTYGNSGSTIELVNTRGYLNQANGTAQTYNVNIKLKKSTDADGNALAALTFSDGYSGDDRTFAGKVSGDGDMVRSATGPGTLSFTFSGDVSEWTGNFLHTADVTDKNTSLTFTGDATTINAGINASVTNASLSLVVDNDSDVAVNGDITGNVAVTYRGMGTKTVSSDASTYTGATTIEAGKVIANADNALGSGAITLSGGTLEIAADKSLTNSTVTVGAETGLTLLGGSTLTATIGITNSGTVTLHNGATIGRLTGSRGTLVINASASSADLAAEAVGEVSVGTFTNNGWLDMGANTLTLTNGTTAGGNVASTGMVTLGADSTFTTLSAAKLAADGWTLTLTGAASSLGVTGTEASIVLTGRQLTLTEQMADDQPVPTVLKSLSLSGTSLVSAAGSLTVTGDVTSCTAAEDITLEEGDETGIVAVGDIAIGGSTVQGNLKSTGGNIALGNASAATKVTGNVHTGGGTLTLGGAASVTGAVTNVSTLAIDSTFLTKVVGSSGTAALTAGSFTPVKVSAMDQLTVSFTDIGHLTHIGLADNEGCILLKASGVGTALEAGNLVLAVDGMAGTGSSSFSHGAVTYTLSGSGDELMLTAVVTGAEWKGTEAAHDWSSSVFGAERTVSDELDAYFSAEGHQTVTVIGGVASNSIFVDTTDDNGNTGSYTFDGAGTDSDAITTHEVSITAGGVTLDGVALAVTAKDATDKTDAMSGEVVVGSYGTASKAGLALTDDASLTAEKMTIYTANGLTNAGEVTVTGALVAGKGITNTGALTIGSGSNVSAIAGTAGDTGTVKVLGGGATIGSVGYTSSLAFVSGGYVESQVTDISLVAEGKTPTEISATDASLVRVLGSVEGVDVISATNRSHVYLVGLDEDTEDNMAATLTLDTVNIFGVLAIAPQGSGDTRSGIYIAADLTVSHINTANDERCFLALTANSKDYFDLKVVSDTDDARGRVEAGGIVIADHIDLSQSSAVGNSFFALTAKSLTLNPTLLKDATATGLVQLEGALLPFDSPVLTLDGLDDELDDTTPADPRVLTLALDGLPDDIFSADAAEAAEAIADYTKGFTAGSYILIGNVGNEGVTVAMDELSEANMKQIFAMADYDAVFGLVDGNYVMTLTKANDRTWNDTAPNVVTDDRGPVLYLDGVKLADGNTALVVDKYDWLNTVDQVKVENGYSFDLRDENMTDLTDAERGLTIRHLSGTGDLELVGDGQWNAEKGDLATLINGRATELEGNLIATDITVQVEGNGLTVQDVTLSNAALVVKADSSLNVDTLYGDDDSMVSGKVNVKVGGGSYSGSYGSAEVSLVSGVSQTLATGAGLTVSGTGGTATLEYVADPGTHTPPLGGIAPTGTAVDLMTMAADGSMQTLSLGADSSMAGGTLSFSVNAQDVHNAANGVGAAPGVTTGANLDLTGTEVVVTQYDEATMPARTTFDLSEGTEGRTLITLADGGTAEGSTVTLNGAYFARHFTNARLEGGTIVADLFTEYYGSKVGQTENGKAGLGLVGTAALELNPQDAAPNGDLAAVLDALDGYVAASAAGDASAAKAADKLGAAVAGSGVAAYGMALSADVERQLKAIRNRTTTMGVNQAVMNEDMPYFNAWINAEGDYRQMDDDETMSGYTMNSWGGTVGFDVDCCESFTCGLAVTAMYGDFSADAADRVEGDVENYYLSAFARATSGAWVHTFVATVGMSSSTLERTVNYGGGSYRTEGDADGSSFGLLYEVARTYALDEDMTACWQPVFNVSYRHVAVDAYEEKEQGSDAALEFGEQSLDTVTFGLGARVQAIVGESLYNRTSIFEARVLAKLDTGDTQGEVDSALLMSSASPRTVKGAEAGAFGVEAGLGLTVPLGAESGSLFLDASVEYRASYMGANGTVGYRVNF